MRKKLNRVVAVALSASMVTPTVAPSITAFAEERTTDEKKSSSDSENEGEEDAKKTEDTNSDSDSAAGDVKGDSAEKDTENKDTEDADTENKDSENKDSEEKDAEDKDTEGKDSENEDTKDEGTENKNSENKDSEEKDSEDENTEEKKDENVAEDETKKEEASEKKTEYPKFGSTKFWSWFGSYVKNEAADDEEDETVPFSTILENEELREALQGWYDSIVDEDEEDEVASASELKKTETYPSFGDDDFGSDEFWDWFDENATIRNEDDETVSYDVDVVLAWIKQADFEDVFRLITNLYMTEQTSLLSAIGSFWPDNYGAGADLYSHGNGTEESPYIIDSVEDLRFLAINIAQNLHNKETYYYIESGTYDLNGSWIPIGFQKNPGENATAFLGHIAADDNANICNLGFNAYSTIGVTAKMSENIRAQNATGFFGEIGAGATVTNLHINTNGNTLEGSDYAGILAGHVVDAKIKNCTVTGIVKGKGYVGGIAGFAESSTTQKNDRKTIIEDCSADKVAAYTNEAVTLAAEFMNGHSCVGGIAGFAKNTSIIDSYVSTNTGAGNHIYGNGAYVGGVAGAIQNADVYNSYVEMGEIGSNNSYAVGGLVGGYKGGNVKVARFSATAEIPSSTNNYSAAFIGTRIDNAGFTYGEDGNLAYLFADNKTKADTGICGSRVADDGKFGKEAHIGYWHQADNYYTIVSGSNIQDSKDYFYKELEHGILKIREKDNSGNVKTINHFTADKQGRPTRGYLLTINDPKVDRTKAANVSAYISGSYKPTVTSENLGAFAPGDVVYVSFEALHDGNGYFQMDKTKTENPFINYYEHDDFNVYKDETTKEGITEDAGYYFTMPDSDVTLGAIYKQVSQAVTLSPSKIVFEVTQTRTGSRENPTLEYYVTAYNGDKDKDSTAKVITDYKGNKWNKRKIMTITPDGHVSTNAEDQFWLNSLVNGGDNNKFNLSWAMSNDSNHNILSNMTVDNGLTNGKQAYFTFDLTDNSALGQKLTELAEEQKSGGYKDSMTTNQPYWYHSVISAKAQVVDSEDKENPPIGYTDVDIKLNVDDQTAVSVQGAALTKNKVTYDVVRTLSGDRANPTVKYTVNGESPDSANEAVAALGVTFNPSYFSNQDVNWYMTAVKADDLTDAGEMTDAAKKNAVDSDMDKQDDGTLNVSVTGTGDNAYQNATVLLKGIKDSTCDNAWIKGLVDAENDKFTKELKTVPEKNYQMQKFVKVTGKDSNNNSATDTCLVTVNFKTVDNTEIMPTKVEIDNKSNVKNYEINYTFKGNSTSEVTNRNLYSVVNGTNSLLSGGIGEKLSATVSPVYDPNTDTAHSPYDNTVTWSLQNADLSGQPNLDPYDVLNIDKTSGQITVRGYSDSTDPTDMGYSPWIKDQISKDNLNGVTVKLNAVATSNRDNSKVDIVPITVTFKAGTMSSEEDSLNFNLVYTKNVNTSLAGTSVLEQGGWSGTDQQTITATATGTSEIPTFVVLDKDGTKKNTSVVSLSAKDDKNTTGVNVKTDADWIKKVIDNRKNGNTGSAEVLVRAKTSNGTSISDVPVNVTFRYDGVDMTAAKVGALPAGYDASPDAITSTTPENTYDTEKATVKDREITLQVVATQGNYSVNNPGTRKWSYGIAKLSNTTYSSEGVKSNDAVYELSGDIKNYCKVDKDGYLVPIKGLWDDVIASNETKGSVSGIVTAKKEIDGKTTSDSYKVTINFRYDKAVLESNEETFNVVYTDDSRTNSVKSHWSGDDKIQLKAHISDESGKDVTPVWESSDPDIVTVDQDGRVSVKKDTWIKDIIDNAQNYEEDTHSGSRTVTVTAKHPTTGATADTCTFTVNFRYDNVIVDKTAETYNLIMTQTSRTNNPSHVWSGNDIRKINAKAFVAPGQSNRILWSSEDTGILKVDEAGNIEPVIDADWQKEIIAQHKFSGQKKVAAIAQNTDIAGRDHTNVTVNFQYEDVEMSENAKNMDIVITATGNSSYPTYTVTGATNGALSAVLNSANAEETGLKWSSSDAGLYSVDQNGKLSLVLPTEKNSKGEIVQSQGRTFSDKAHALIKEALKHGWTERNPYITSGTFVVTASSMDGRMADQCNVKVNIKFINNTYTSSGGGSSSGGGGGSYSTSTTPTSSRTSMASGLPVYVVKGGTWVQDNSGNWYYSNGRTYTNEWAAIQNPYADTAKGQSQFDWFHFGADSVMTTGWYTDEAGDTFYLNPVSDNTKGRMFTGWNWIDDDGDGIAECYYFETVSNGRRGRLYKATVTPDGYAVNEKGQWNQNGIVIQKNVATNIVSYAPATSQKKA